MKTVKLGKLAFEPGTVEYYNEKYNKIHENELK